MAYITVPKIQRSNTTTTTDYDILNDDLDLLAQLKVIQPDFPTKPIAMDVSVFLETGAGCQIQVNGSEYQDFLSDITYSLDKERGKGWIRRFIGNVCTWRILTE